MNQPRHAEAGFTLVELLVSILLFSLITGAFYSVLFSGTSGSRTARDIADIAEEARLGVNRMLRDTREAKDLTSAGPTSYTIKVDFNGSGVAGDSVAGQDEETLVYSFDENTETIRLNGEVLIAGVQKIAGRDVFTYSSNLLEYDWNNDGVTTLSELEAAASQSPPVALSANKLIYISNISYYFNLRSGDRASVVRAQAELRNHDGT